MAEDDEEQSEEQQTPTDQLTPEQRAQLDQVIRRARGALGRVSGVGCLGMIFRMVFGRLFRFPRLRNLRHNRKVVFLGVGLLVMALSIFTCSAGVNLRNLTEQYGDPVPASVSTAERFIRRAAGALQGGAPNRGFRITVSEVEATSALSLGMMIPELTAVMDSTPPEFLRQTDDLTEMRRLLRERAKQRAAQRSFREKVARLLDPDLHTGDVQVHFTGNGEIVMAGYVEAWRWRQPALVVFAPRARSGELELNFISGKLGRLPAPAWAFNALGDLAASLILQGREYAEISELTVSDGRLTFAARINR